MEIAYKIIQDIKEKINYIHLCTSIVTAEKGGIANDMVKQAIIAGYEFVNNSIEAEIIEKGPLVLNMIEPLYQASLRNFPPKKDVVEIAKEFNEFCKRNPDYYQHGIVYGWLNDLMDCTKLYRGGLPSHARVGVNMHAGKFVIEESMILRDAFFFLVLAEKELEKIEKMAQAEKWGSKKYSNKEIEIARIGNLNVGTFCRTAHLNFYSFVEAFVNGIGLDHLFVHAAKLTRHEQELLQGKKKNSHISLEKKIEKFHEIIRPDGIKVIITTDPNQIKEPFKTFFDECKEIRDSSVHFSALKEPIVRRPHEWMEKVHLYSKLSLEVAMAFWSACYINKNYPDYLDILDYKILRNIALKRVGQETS